MKNLDLFCEWLKLNTTFTTRTISNVKSRLKRANSILQFQNDDVYLFRLEQKLLKSEISSSVKSQIKKSVELYFDFLNKDEQK